MENNCKFSNSSQLIVITIFKNNDSILLPHITAKLGKKKRNNISSSRGISGWCLQYWWGAAFLRQKRREMWVNVIQWWSFEDKGQQGVGFCSKISWRFFYLKIFFIWTLLNFKWVTKKCLNLTFKFNFQWQKHLNLEYYCVWECWNHPFGSQGADLCFRTGH